MEFRYPTQPWLHTHGHFAARNGTSCENSRQDEIGTIIKKCLARIRSWPIPRNWSFRNWFDEAEEVATVAAWLAASDYQQPAASAFPTFVHQRVLSTVRTRYRQEFLYGLRFGCRLLQHIGDSEEQSRDWTPAYMEPFIEPTAYCDLSEALTKLSKEHREVIEQIYLSGRTEMQLATSLRISRVAVNKRKQAALRILRELLQEK